MHTVNCCYTSRLGELSFSPYQYRGALKAATCTSLMKKRGPDILPELNLHFGSTLSSLFRVMPDIEFFKAQITLFVTVYLANRPNGCIARSVRGMLRSLIEYFQHRRGYSICRRALYYSVELCFSLYQSRGALKKLPVKVGR